VPTPCVLLVPSMGESRFLGWITSDPIVLLAAPAFAYRRLLPIPELTARFERSPVVWTTGGSSPHALAVRATLDSFDGPQR
jgi:hypothetical protein